MARLRRWLDNCHGALDARDGRDAGEAARPASATARFAVACSVLASVALMSSCRSSDGDAGSGGAPSNALDGRSLPPRDAAPFSFVVAGHVYGRPGLSQPRPASTLVAGARWLSADSPDFSVLLGDTVFGWQSEQLGETLPFLREQLPGPVFQAVGNHELSDPARNEALFGARYHAFDHGGCRMVVLDSESDPWLVRGRQLEFLSAELDAAAQRAPRPRAFFLFSHKPIWAMTERTVLAAILGNDQVELPALLAGHQGPSSFAKVVLPRLRALAASVPVCCFAGDVGAFPPDNLHLFAQRDPQAPGLRYFAVGLGDDPRDAFLSVQLPEEGEPLVRARALADGAQLPLEDYDHESWLQRRLPGGVPKELAAILAR